MPGGMDYVEPPESQQIGKSNRNPWPLAMAAVRYQISGPGDEAGMPNSSGYRTPTK